VAEWRAGRRWSRSELEQRLAALDDLESSLDPGPPESLTEDRGWHTELSESMLGRERAGPPEPDGLFARARDAMMSYRFSDPTIVCAHYRPETRLLGRSMLLEIKVLGLRYLSGVRVTDIMDRSTDERTRWGFRYETLAGHIERGVEWFELIKDHDSGRVRVRIRSRWRPGDLPNTWSRIGFAALAGFYRRLWLRRAHQRLAVMARTALPRPERFAHEGLEVASLPRTAAAAGVARTLVTATALGALSGLRTFAGPALLAARGVDLGPQPGAGRLERGLARPGTAFALAAAEAGELVADKHPRMPSRLDPPALAGRVGAGAASGAALAARWCRAPWLAAIAGGTAAAATSVGGARLRARLQARLPRLVAAACEDLLVLGAGATLWQLAGTPARRTGRVRRGRGLSGAGRGGPAPFDAVAVAIRAARAQRP
jgi:uncharacterized protein (UPF0548 family)/uncharacterized membrane protein